MLKPRASSFLLAFVLAGTLAVRADDALPKATVIAPAAKLTLELATDEPTRAHGLMERTGLAPHTGMLFVFDREAPVSFWMKNTLIPLDMVFVAANGSVTGVSPKVPATTHDTPDEKIPRRAGLAKFVIELPAGEAAKDGIKPGAKLVIHEITAQ